MDPANEVASPWWYRWRSWVMGGIVYLALYLRSASRTRFRSNGSRSTSCSGAGEQWVFAGAFALTALCWILRVWLQLLRPSVIWSPDARTDSLVRDRTVPLHAQSALPRHALARRRADGIGPPAGVPIVLFCALVFIQGLIAFEERELSARYAPPSRAIERRYRGCSHG